MDKIQYSKDDCVFFYLTLNPPGTIFPLVPEGVFQFLSKLEFSELECRQLPETNWNKTRWLNFEDNTK